LFEDEVIMEIYLIIMLVLMILGSVHALHTKDLISTVISLGIVGFGLVISFLILSAPDLAIVQVVIEIITLAIMIAVIAIATFQLEKKQWRFSFVFYAATIVFFTFVVLLVSSRFSHILSFFGHHTTRMADIYMKSAADSGSANLVTGIILHFRAYDTFGEATVLVTAVTGVLTILRHSGKKNKN